MVAPASTNSTPVAAARASDSSAKAPAKLATIDANEAVASVAYRLSELFAIYPITPSSPMAEHVDEFAVAKKKNLWGQVPEVVEMQSEAGVAGALHGALQGGILASTFTASQGLLLMIPNMYKIAGELTPCVLHVTARTIATHALSIFGDHSDVMACRQTGWAMLASNTPQESQDIAAIAHTATLRARVPIMHFFDGFRTSHEINTLEPLADATLNALFDAEAHADFRSRALTPDAPSLRGSAQNPDVFFQAREAANAFYDALPALIEETMNKFAALTGREYSLCEYEGHPEAERVVIAIGSSTETLAETAHFLNSQGEKVGVLKVRLYRPFPLDAFLDALPANARHIAVLDRTKEPGALGDPLFLDVSAALHSPAALARRGSAPLTLIGGRYGLASKEFTPAMCRAVFAELRAAKPRHGFTVGINDDLTHRSLAYDAAFDLEPADRTRAIFYGLGSDGTVGANKNTIKIIGDHKRADGKPTYGQAYFVYDSKKSGAVTTSHLRFGPAPIRAPYLITQANFVACHQYHLLDTQPVLSAAAHGATFLLNAPGPIDTLWSRFTRETQHEILAKKLRVYAIDAAAVARAAGLGNRINTIMQTCFFALTGVLPAEAAIASIKKSIAKSYAKAGEDVVTKNVAAVDSTLAALAELSIPSSTSSESVLSSLSRNPPVPEGSPDHVQNITAVILAGYGDRLPVSAFAPDGVWPTGTSRYEKRNLAAFIPVWDATACIQCNKCVAVCPHAAIRAKFYPDSLLDQAPDGWHATPFKSTEHKGNHYTLQVAPEDCTGCELCVHACPVKDKANPDRRAINMAPQTPLRAQEKLNFDYFLKLPNVDRATFKADTPKNAQFLEPLFEFSGACSGCGETPYLKLLTQLYGDRLTIANATGCSSIFGGNLPTTPYAKNSDGRGPAWANSLFEDNAEFGLGLRLSLDLRANRARHLLQQLAPTLGDDFATALLTAPQTTDPEIHAQRVRVVELRKKLFALTATNPAARELAPLADHLVKKTLWIVGGDGWAYDIGYGGLDHVIASGRKVNILVLDTEVYSNTGGQCSKATPLGAAARFTMGGKPTAKKDLGLLAMTYGNVYVARIAMGARDTQTLQALRDADNYDGPSLVIAYSPCIAHGFDISKNLEHQKLAVDTGHWPLFRYDPRRAEKGEAPLQLDSPAPKLELKEFTRSENRYNQIARRDPALVEEFERLAQQAIHQRYALYQQLATKPKS